MACQLPYVIGALKEADMSDQWGLCKDCKWWQIEPGAPYLLRVSGDSGCNRFMEGEPARAKGSSGQPPAAKPTR
jgi:hypothetical protein